MSFHATLTPFDTKAGLTDMRITLIHALKHSIVPIEASFARLWPDATLMNLVDDSLSADLARDGQPHERNDRSFPHAWTLRGLDRL